MSISSTVKNTEMEQKPVKKPYDILPNWYSRNPILKCSILYNQGLLMWRNAKSMYFGIF